MESVYDTYELVVGLEVHIQLITKSKAYSSDSTSYGASPNTQVSPVSLGLPGTLPVVNQKVIEYAVKMGLACHCQIRRENRYARKNYFYADLPKGYQITQDTTPICNGGYLEVKNRKGETRKIELERIHMEEDTGKSMHDQDPYDTLIDLNRAGTPLLEVVSRPDIRDAVEAYNYLSEIRKLVRYLEICDGNMEEGSLRCDANISVRKKGAAEFGTKVEVKNMNSMRNVQKAIEYEFQRQIDALEAGEKIYQETRNFEALSGKTFAMRSKESANDYRYFPEPDLPPVYVEESYIEEVKKSMPPLPGELFLKYTSLYQLPESDAYAITESRQEALFFEAISAHTGNKKAAANWLLVQIKSYLNEKGISIDEFPVTPQSIAHLIQLIDDKKISHSVASQQIFPALLQEPSANPEEIAQRMNLLQENDAGQIEPLVIQVLESMPEKVNEYKAGKTGLLGLFMGEVMKLSKGKADPKMATSILKKYLDA